MAKAPPGVRSRAISIEAGEASNPLTLMPRRAASMAAMPLPQPMSKSERPGPAFTFVSTTSNAGRSVRSWSVAHERACADQSSPCSCAVPIAMFSSLGLPKDKWRSLPRYNKGTWKGWPSLPFFGPFRTIGRNWPERATPARRGMGAQVVRANHAGQRTQLLPRARAGSVC